MYYTKKKQKENILLINNCIPIYFIFPVNVFLCNVRTQFLQITMQFSFTRTMWDRSVQSRGGDTLMKEDFETLI